MSDSYIPSDIPFFNRDPKGRVPGLSNRTVISHIDAILQHGPVPRNWDVELCFQTTRSGAKLHMHRYIEKPSGRKLEAHPNSPAGRQVAPVIQNEFRYDRENITGVYHPPIPAFKVGELNFRRHDDFLCALAASLTDSGCNYTLNGVNGPVTAAKLARDHEKLSQNAHGDPNSALKNQFFHPADRSTAIFAGEPECARLAQYWSRDLAILCPLTSADGHGYDRIYQQSNRPPVYWRWSLGEHGLNKTTTLACLPVLGEANAMEAHWFTVTPAPNHQITWDKFFKRNRDFKSLKRQFEFPESLSTERFIWTLVAAHRTHVNGATPKNVEFGHWVHQYGLYIKKYDSEGHERKFEFKYDSTHVYSGRRITFEELGACILNSDASLKYVRLWEKANDAYVEWLFSKTDATLQAFQYRMQNARALPD